MAYGMLKIIASAVFHPSTVAWSIINCSFDCHRYFDYFLIHRLKRDPLLFRVVSDPSLLRLLPDQWIAMWSLAPSNAHWSITWSIIADPSLNLLLSDPSLLRLLRLLADPLLWSIDCPMIHDSFDCSLIHPLHHPSDLYSLYMHINIISYILNWLIPCIFLHLLKLLIPIHRSLIHHLYHSSFLSWSITWTI